MSHSKERAEKNCLNCNAEVLGRYCQVCGQENIEPNESFWHLTFHFIGDLFHYDGKVARTINTLLFKPGVLSKEHVRGKRVEYLHPIRLYIFINAIFFLSLFTFLVENKTPKAKKIENKLESYEKKMRQLKRAEDNNNILDSALAEQAKEKIKADTTNLLKDSILETIRYADTVNINQFFVKGRTKANEKKIEIFEDKIRAIEIQIESNNVIDSNKAIVAIQNYKKAIEVIDVDSTSEFLVFAKNFKINSLLKNKINSIDLSEDEKKNFIERWFDSKKNKYENEQEFTEKRDEAIKHSIPKAIFLIIPIYAFFLWVIYNRNKKLNFVNHLIYSIHLFCFTFILLLISISIEHFFINDNDFLSGTLGTSTLLLAMLYTYKAMRNFYGQGRWKTILKFIILSFLFIVLAICVFLVALLFSTFSI